MTDTFHIEKELKVQKELNKELLKQNFKLLAELDILKKLSYLDQPFISILV